MSKINQVRTTLLSASDSQALTESRRNEMRELVAFFGERYGSQSSIDVRKAMKDMGLSFSESAEENSILKASDGITRFAVLGEKGSPEATSKLIRLLGVYLFTNRLVEDDYFYDSRISITEEKLINEFSLLMTLPGFKADEYVPINQLVQWSIDYNIPLPNIRETLSL